MFGFSLGKLLVTVVVVLAVWYGFKLITKDEGMPKVAKAGKKQRHDVTVDAEDLVECKICAAYVAPSTAQNCGQENCPYPT